MLTICPECGLQLSNKAQTCPHCGYPLKDNFQNFTPRKKSRKRRRLPNGFGQITELKNKKLRKPFRVMVTVAKDEFGKPICKLLKPTAYFKTYNEAYEALLKYNKSPYDPDAICTMGELFKTWVEKYYTDHKTKKQAYANWTYLSPLHNLLVLEVRIKHLRCAIEEATVERNGQTVYATDNVKFRLKFMLNLMFDYAVEYEMTDKNYAREFSIEETQNTRETPAHKAFTQDELNLLWQNINDMTVQLVLIQCYTGWRPAELVNLKLEDVNINELTVYGGMKTKAGKGRIVPIHPRIASLIADQFRKSAELGSDWLFPSKTDKTKPLSYYTYRQSFNRIEKEIGLSAGHKLHDGRKTFITLAKKYNVNEYAIKRIVGHTITDLTERVYTDRNINWLAEEMKKIP